MLLCSQANFAANWFLISPHQELNKAGCGEGIMSKYELIFVRILNLCSFHNTSHYYQNQFYNLRHSKLMMVRFFLCSELTVKYKHKILSVGSQVIQYNLWLNEIRISVQISQRSRHGLLRNPPQQYRVHTYLHLFIMALHFYFLELDAFQ